MLKLNTVIKSITTNESGELEIAGKASSPAVDRARDVILAEAWAKGGVDNYRKNPILLFNHDYNEPIGKVTHLELNEEGLSVKGVVFEGTKAYTLIQKGVLKTFSVGFLIKDADYNRATDGLIIKDAELLEISVVSVPCNQEATFEVAKSYSNQEFEDLKEKFGKDTDKGALASSENKMDEDTVNELIAKAMASAKGAGEELTEAKVASIVASVLAEKDAADKAKVKAAEEEEVKFKAIEDRVRTSLGASEAEKIEAAVKSALEQSAEVAQKELGELRESVKTYAEDIKALQNSRGGFFPDRGADRTKWMENPETRSDAMDMYILSKALRKPIDGFDAGKEFMQKVNDMSSVQVSSSSFEELVSTEIYRDIEQELVIAKLFREVQLRSASQLLTIAPDTGYATHQATGSTLPGTKPNGLLNEIGGGQPYTLSEIQLRTDKLVSKAYLANDTEEDAILPILPIIRDGMIRQHAKSVDQMILTAGIAGSTYPNMVSNGLLKYAASGGRTVAGPGAGDPYTGAHLLAGRSAMGKYGINPQDIVYVVSTNAYFSLLKDEAFYNNDEVGTGTKVTGEVGRMFGSRVLVSSEMSDATTENAIGAIALNTRNFVVPRLRGLTSESEYSVDGQHWLLATTQRLGFTEIIPGAPSIVAIDYAA